MAGSDMSMMESSCSNPNVTAEQLKQSNNQTTQSNDPLADEPVNPNDDWQTLYNAGKASLKAGSFTQSITQLTACLEKARAECDDEFSLILAPLYSDYGSALLSLYQSTTSALGDTITNDPTAKQVGVEQGGLLGELDEEDDLEEAIRQSLGQSTEQSNDQTSDQPAEATAEDADDLELAFDMFEMARVIYQKSSSFLDGQTTNQSPESSNHHAIYQSITYIPSHEWDLAVQLSRVHEKLAQCEQEMEKFDQSYSDSFAALLILQAINQAIEQSKDSYSSSSSNQSNNQSTSRPQNPNTKQSNLYRDFAGIHMDLAVCSLHHSKVEAGLHHYMQANIAIYQAINQYFQQIAIATQKLAIDSTVQPSTQSSNQLGNQISLEVDTNELSVASETINQSIKQWSSVEAIYASIKECEELVSELNERITDLKMEVERSKQEKLEANQPKPDASASTSIGFHNQPFDIPKLSFSVPPPNQLASSTTQSTSQSNSTASSQPTNQLAVKRRVAPVSNATPTEEPEAKRPKL